MTFYIVRIFNNNVMLLFMFGIVVTLTSAHRCYVCGPDEIQCDNFDQINSGSFIKECPINSKGCSIRQEGSVIIRRCEDIKVDDCKIANNVNYCYCSQELCNGIFHHHPTDDEDLLEGSGIRNIATNSISENPVTLETPNKASDLNYVNIFVYIILSLAIL